MAKMKQPGGVAAKAEAMVRPVLEQQGLALWDVRFEKEGPDWYLKVLFDKADPAQPMDTDTCEAASRAIARLLDEDDPITQHYFLEVGSPGLGRALTRAEHFQAVQGRKVLAKLYAADAAGRKEVAGTLLSAGEDRVLLATEDGEAAVAMKDASGFKLCDDEDLI